MLRGKNSLLHLLPAHLLLTYSQRGCEYSLAPGNHWHLHYHRTYNITKQVRMTGSQIVVPSAFSQMLPLLWQCCHFQLGIAKISRRDKVLRC